MFDILFLIRVGTAFPARCQAVSHNNNNMFRILLYNQSVIYITYKLNTEDDILRWAQKVRYGTRWCSSGRYGSSLYLVNAAGVHNVRDLKKKRKEKPRLVIQQRAVPTFFRFHTTQVPVPYRQLLHFYIQKLPLLNFQNFFKFQRKTKKDFFVLYRQIA